MEILWRNGTYIYRLDYIDIDVYIYIKRETALCLNRLERVEFDTLGALFDLDGDFIAER